MSKRVEIPIDTSSFEALDEVAEAAKAAGQPPASLNEALCQLALLHYVAWQAGPDGWYKPEPTNSASKGIMGELSQETGVGHENTKIAVTTNIVADLMEAKYKPQQPNSRRPDIMQNIRDTELGITVLAAVQSRFPDAIKTVKAYRDYRLTKQLTPSIYNVREDIRRMRASLGRKAEGFEDLDSFDGPDALKLHLADLYREQSELSKYIK